MAKVIRIDDSGYIWDVPLGAIAKHRANYYAKRDPDTSFQEEFDFVMSDDYEGLDWFLNNMDFEDVQEFAQLIQTPEPLTKPRPALWECEIIETDDAPSA